VSLVAILGPDLLMATRIGDAAVRAGLDVVRLDDPARLPPADDVAVAFVDWSFRQPGWGDAIALWRDAAAVAPRIVLFGPHTDVAAHHAARSAGIGPMLARSKLILDLPTLLARPGQEAVSEHRE
jgi:hypothetical protein